MNSLDSTTSRRVAVRLGVPVLLAFAVLVPYWRMLSGGSIPIPDDIFISDLVDAEFPIRVEAGRILRSGDDPIWTSRVAMGSPIILDPLSERMFEALPASLALGWLIGIYLLIAALGTYALARHHGATEGGAVLAGFTFAWSGFFVCQLRHLGVLGTVAFFPVALHALDRIVVADRVGVGDAIEVPWRQRLGPSVLLAIVYGLQLLAGFPQSAYICALAYALAFAFRLVVMNMSAARGTPTVDRIRATSVASTLALGAMMVGAMIGARALVPLRALGAVSDRSGGGTFAWATQFSYPPEMIWSFFDPYVLGDVSESTYRGGGVFWEVYGYVGVATLLFAFVGIVAWGRRFAVWSWVVITILAFAMVLGPTLPLYRIAFDHLPGLSTFRMPTRFLFVVELGLALLGGFGLSCVEGLVAARLEHSRKVDIARWLALFAAAVISIDLVLTNARQNPFVSARTWMSPPQSAVAIRQSGGGRVYTPFATSLHVAAFRAARGWSGSLEPYVRHREALQPNSNLLHGVSTLGGYSGIAPSWFVDVVGDHNRPGLLDALVRPTGAGLELHPALFDWLEALSVRWLVLPTRVTSERAEFVRLVGPFALYRVPRSLPRARLVHRTRLATSFDDVRRSTLERSVDLRVEAFVQESRDLLSVPAGSPPDVSANRVRIVGDRATRVEVDVSTASTAMLVLSDTYYPGWHATLDGREVRVARVNVTVRGVRVPAGRHRVVFTFEPPESDLGSSVSAFGIVAVLIAALVAIRARSRGENSSRRNEPS